MSLQIIFCSEVISNAFSTISLGISRRSPCNYHLLLDVEVPICVGNYMFWHVIWNNSQE